MKTENVQELFRIKLDMEMKRFEQNILKGTVEEVFNSAYEIQMKKTIYECLWEVSQKLDISVLEKLLLFPNLLDFLYMRWLKVEDKQWNILSEFLGDEIKGLVTK